jgi:hypothetical protein
MNENLKAKVHYIQLAEDSDQRCVLLNTVKERLKEIRIPVRAGKLLSG